MQQKNMEQYAALVICILKFLHLKRDSSKRNRLELIKNYYFLNQNLTPNLEINFFNYFKFYNINSINSIKCLKVVSILHDNPIQSSENFLIDPKAPSINFIHKCKFSENIEYNYESSDSSSSQYIPTKKFKTSKSSYSKIIQDIRSKAEQLDCTIRENNIQINADDVKSMTEITYMLTTNMELYFNRISADKSPIESKYGIHSSQTET